MRNGARPRRKLPVAAPNPPAESEPEARQDDEFADESSEDVVELLVRVPIEELSRQATEPPKGDAPAAMEQPPAPVPQSATQRHAEDRQGVRFGAVVEAIKAADGPAVAGVRRPARLPAHASLGSSEEIRFARLHLRTGSLLQARSTFEALAANDLLDRAGTLDLAEARWRTGDIAGAGVAAVSYIAQDGDEVLGYLIAAEAAAAGGHIVEAERHAGLAIKRSVAYLETYFAGVPCRLSWPESSWSTPLPVPIDVPAPPVAARDQAVGSESIAAAANQAPPETATQTIEAPAADTAVEAAPAADVVEVVEAEGPSLSAEQADAAEPSPTAETAVEADASEPSPTAETAVEADAAEPSPTAETAVAADAAEPSPTPDAAEAALAATLWAHVLGEAQVEPAPQTEVAPEVEAAAQAEVEAEPEPAAMAAAEPAPEPEAATVAQSAAAPNPWDSEITAGAVALASGDALMAALHFAVALRMDPGSAHAVVEGIGERRELALELVRGDALRLLGNETGAGQAYASLASQLSRPAVAPDPGPTPSAPDRGPAPDAAPAAAPEPALAPAASASEPDATPATPGQEPDPAPTAGSPAPASEPGSLAPDERPTIRWE